MKVKKACFIGNPNVGKSSLFNYLTHSTEHTGNWTGKTVACASSKFVYKDTLWEVVDLPGTYSLNYESEEEGIASGYVLQKDYDLAIVVVDASNLERSITILFEVLDVTNKVILCVNLIDEAEKMHLKIDKELLQQRLDVPVIFMSVKKGIGIEELCEEMNHYEEREMFHVVHDKKIVHFLEKMQETRDEAPGILLQTLSNTELVDAMNFSSKELSMIRFYKRYITRYEILSSYYQYSSSCISGVISRKEVKEKKEDSLLNKLFTGRFTGFLMMTLLLFFLLWLTIFFSNIPSDFLMNFFSSFEPFLFKVLSFLPDTIVDPLIFGGYRTLYWVVSVMAPPMLIFFPLFSLLEDYGVLPRIAFNLDQPFAKCGSCGKQSLTMCMGLGCNAVGVTGARIMENKKMRILAILTNAFMPCNGRFPAMICMIQMFFITDHSIFGSLKAAAILCGIILCGIFLTFCVTKLCNYFLFKEEKAMFIMELPTFRKPKIISTIVTSIKDKAFDVLKRAMIVSFPAGLLLFFASNISIFGTSIFGWITEFLTPFGQFIGVDGVILLSFLFGLPANEIVIPVMLLGYLNSNSLVSYDSIETLKSILVLHGWDTLVALKFLILSLCHFPCATTLITIKKETNSTFYTILAFLIPTIIGLGLCVLVTVFFG